MKRAVVTIVQIAITVGVLAYLLRSPEKRAEMGRALMAADRAWLVAGFLAYGVVEFLVAVRWDTLLRVQGIFLSRARLTKLTLIGLFFSFFTPGGTGADVVRAYYLLKEAPGKGPAAVLSVLIDRVVGLFAVIALGAVMIAWQWTWLTSTAETRQFVLSSLVILGVGIAAVGFSAVLSGFGWVHRLPPKFPFRDKIAELALAFNQYGHAWRASLNALISSLVCHLGYFYVFYCAGRAFASPGVRVPTLVEMFAVMPVVNTIISLPIGMNGLGVREVLFQSFFSKLAGVSEGVAVLTSSTGFLLTAVWGVVGGLLYVFYRPSEHARLREISAKMAALEHEVAETEMALETADDSKR